MSRRAPALAEPLTGPGEGFFMGSPPHDGESRSKCAVTFR